METLPFERNVSPDKILPALCPVCHQAILLHYYFCPNCGTTLHKAPLSTSLMAQVGLYAFSIVLPMIGFLLITRWKGNAYYKSQDLNAKQIGLIAWILLLLSTVLTIWYAVVWTQNYIKETVSSINADLSGL